MRNDSPLLCALLHYRYYRNFTLIANLCKQHMVNVEYPVEVLNTISEFTRKYEKMLKAYEKSDVGERPFKTIIQEDNQFVNQKHNFLERIVAGHYGSKKGHSEKLFQIQRAANGMTNRRLYSGIPLLEGVNEQELESKEDRLIQGLEENEEGLVSFLAASVNTTVKAMMNKNKIKPEFIPSPDRASEVKAELLNLDFAWINDFLRRRIFYLRSSRDEREIPLRFLLTDISTLFLHSAPSTQLDKVAKEAFEEYAIEIREICSQSNTNEFFRYYSSLRKDLHEITRAFKYYNPKSKKSSQSVAS